MDLGKVNQTSDLFNVLTATSVAVWFTAVSDRLSYV